MFEDTTRQAIIDGQAGALAPPVAAPVPPKPAVRKPAAPSADQGDLF
jgi:hypothetical protein